MILHYLKNSQNGLITYALGLFFILFMGIPVASALGGTSEKVSAGLILHLGDQLSLDRLHFLENYASCSQDTQNIALILFSRQDHHYSHKMKNELNLLLDKDGQGQIFIWEFMLKQAGQETVNSTDETPQWVVKTLTEKSIFSLFGIKVFPSLFILNSQFIITDYLAGLPDNTRLLLSALVIDSTLSQRKQPVSHQAKQKRQNRREHFAFELYHTDNYTGALQQLEKLTSCSDKAMLVNVYALIQLERFSEAQTLLEQLSQSNYKPEQISYTKSLIFYYQNQFEEAKKELGNVQSTERSYQKPYLYSLILEKLSDNKQSKAEYHKAKRMAGRDLRNADLTDLLR